MFDPYHKWLGIPPKDQPPNHYRLLGIDAFEDDAEVIDAAANRQMAYLQQRATGEHAALSQELLNEVAAARLCLLNQEKRAEYDAKLRKQLGEPEEAVGESGPPVLPTKSDSTPATPPSGDPSAGNRTSIVLERLRSLQPWHYAVAAGVVALVLIGPIVVFSPGDSTEVDETGSQLEPAAKQLAQGDESPDEEEEIDDPQTSIASVESEPDEKTEASEEGTEGPDDSSEEKESAGEPHVYDVRISPEHAKLEVQYGEATITGSGRERKIRVECRKGAASSVLVIASCQGYETDSTWVTPSSGKQSLLFLTLTRKKPEPAVFNVTVEPSHARLEVKEAEGEVSGSGRRRTVRIEDSTNVSSVLIRATCQGHESQERRVWLSSTNKTVSISLSKTYRPSKTMKPRKTQTVTKNKSSNVTVLKHSNSVTALACSPSGDIIVTGVGSGHLTWWETNTGKQVRQVRAHDERIEDIEFTRDGKLLATCGRDAKAHLWNPHTGRKIRSFEGHTALVWSVSFSPDGEYLLTGGWGGEPNNENRVWNVQTGQQMRRLPATSKVAWSPKGTVIAMGAEDNCVALWNSLTGQRTALLRGHGAWVHEMAFSTDGAFVVSVSGFPEWEKKASDDVSIRIWSVASGQQVHRLSGHADAVFCVAVASDNKRIVSGGEDKTVRVWDAQSGRELQCLTGHREAVTSVEFVPRTKYIVSVSFDSTARIWRKID